ncbi:uncharacterized protein LOC144784172 [Lissotriton helveticus]
MTQPVPIPVDNIINQLAEGQRHLQLVFEQQLQTAKTERDSLQEALKDQATLLITNQQVQDTAILRLTDAIATARIHPNVPSSVLQKFQDGEDPDYFFTNFERVATTASWPKERWSQYVAPLLAGELQAAYQAANPAGRTSYEDVKKAILERLGCDQEYYRAKFRKERWNPGDNPRALYYRIQDLGIRWLTPLNTTIEDLMAKVFLEQFLDALPPSTRSWIRQHPNLTPTVAVDLACAYHRSPEFRTSSSKAPIPSPRPLIPRPQSRPEPRVPLLPRVPFRPANPGSGSSTQGPQCYHCSEWGHIARNCPLRAQPAEPMEIGYSRGRVYVIGKGPCQYKREVFLNGKKQQALLDTGCRVSVVDTSLVHPQQLQTDETVYVTCVHGNTKGYPVAEVLLEVSNDPQLRRVGVIPSLPEAVIIGTDHPKFDQYIDEAKKDSVNWWREAPFGNSDVEGVAGKDRKSRKEKRKDKAEYSQLKGRLSVFSMTPADTVGPARSFRSAQLDDNTLLHAWEQVQEQDNNKVGPYFYVQQGLLYRTTRKGDTITNQLLVPLAFRRHVLELAHNYTGGGHYGKEQTLSYLLTRFYWPGV